MPSDPEGWYERLIIGKVVEAPDSVVDDHAHLLWGVGRRTGEQRRNVVQLLSDLHVFLEDPGDLRRLGTDVFR